MFTVCQSIYVLPVCILSSNPDNPVSWVLLSSPFYRRNKRPGTLLLVFHNRDVKTLGSKPRSDSSMLSAVALPECFPLVDKVGLIVGLVQDGWCRDFL